MGGPIMRRHVAVLDFDQHVAVLIYQKCAERMIAVGDGAAGDIERPAQEMFVKFGRVHDRSCGSRTSCRGRAGQTSRTVRVWKPRQNRSALMTRHVPAD